MGRIVSPKGHTPGTCGHDLLWKWGLCRHAREEAALARMDPKSNDQRPSKRKGTQIPHGEVTVRMEAEAGVMCPRARGPPAVLATTRRWRQRHEQVLLGVLLEEAVLCTPRSQATSLQHFCASSLRHGSHGNVPQPSSRPRHLAQGHLEDTELNRFLYDRLLHSFDVLSCTIIPGVRARCPQSLLVPSHLLPLGGTLVCPGQCGHGWACPTWSCTWSFFSRCFILRRLPLFHEWQTSRRSGEQPTDCRP